MQALVQQNVQNDDSSQLSTMAVANSIRLMAAIKMSSFKRIVLTSGFSNGGLGAALLIAFYKTGLHARPLIVILS